MDPVLKFSSLRKYVSIIFLVLMLLPVYSDAEPGTGQVTVTSYMSDLGTGTDYTFTVPVPDSLDCSEAADPAECEMQLHPVEAPVDSELNSAYTEAIAGMAHVVDGLAGPVSLGVKYDDDLSWIGTLGYTKMFNKWFGMSAKLAGGPNEWRGNITAGFAIYSHNQIKVTYEYLDQNLPYDFETGEVNERIGQNAIGAAYSYVWPNSVLNAIEISGNWAEASNKSLDSEVFYDDGVPKYDFRNIAGGEEENGLASLKFVPFCRTSLSLGAGYSHVDYDTEFEDDPDTSTVAYNAELSILPTFTTKLTAGVNNTASSREADAKISQIIPGHHVELAVWGLYQHGNDSLPDNRSIMFGVNYPVPRVYQFEGLDQLTRMYNWVNKPVIYYQRVLAIADEKIKKFAIDANALPSQTVAPGQSIDPVSTDDAFDFSKSLFSSVDYSLKVTKQGESSDDDFADDLNLQIVQTSDYSATVSSESPIPDGEDGVYKVTIKAKGQNSGLKSPIVQTASFTLTVSDGAVWTTTTLPDATLGLPYPCVNITEFAEVPENDNANLVYALVSTQPWLQVTTQCLQDGGKHLKQGSTTQYYLVAAGANQDTPVPEGADPAVVLSATTVINGATLATNQNFTLDINQVPPQWSNTIPNFGTVSVTTDLNQNLPIGSASLQPLSQYITQGTTNLSLSIDPNAGHGTNFVPGNWAIVESDGEFFLQRTSSSTADVGAVTISIIATNSTSTSSVSSVPQGISLTVSAT